MFNYKLTTTFYLYTWCSCMWIDRHNASLYVCW